jgi:hypothetical protein
MVKRMLGFQWRRVRLRKTPRAVQGVDVHYQLLPIDSLAGSAHVAYTLVSALAALAIFRLARR